MNALWGCDRMGKDFGTRENNTIINPNSNDPVVVLQEEAAAPQITVSIKETFAARRRKASNSPWWSGSSVPMVSNFSYRALMWCCWLSTLPLVGFLEPNPWIDIDDEIQQEQGEEEQVKTTRSEERKKPKGKPSKDPQTDCWLLAYQEKAPSYFQWWLIG